MKLLAIETSTDACSCALWLTGEVHEYFEIAPRAHGALVLAMVEALLVAAHLRLKELDGIAFGCGPGAFTGLRIAAGVVQGLAFATALPVVPISSLAALAQAIMAEEQILVIQDARMGEVYYGAFKRGLDGMVKEVIAAQVCRPERISPPVDAGVWTVVGSGWQTHGAALAHALAGCEIVLLLESLYPRAGDVASLAVGEFAAGRGLPAERALPVYLRDDVARPHPHFSEHHDHRQ